MTTLAEEIVMLAKEAHHVIATAESCTGGMIAAALTDVPGSSSVVDRGFVTYSNAAKRELLNVQEQTLREFGAVSEDVAHEMAAGAFGNSHASIAVSVTGIAGPGGSEHKPEGMVCFGIAWDQGLETETVQFGAIGRDAVRRATVEHALTMIKDCILNKDHDKKSNRASDVALMLRS
jgi:nicotinamide-nucleotide amidase